MDNKSIEIVSDAYIENFEGEFPFKPWDLENNEQEKFDYQLLSRRQTASMFSILRSAKTV